MADDDELVTKGFLRGEMQAMERRIVDGVRGEMGAMERRLVEEIGGIVQRAIGITTEQSRTRFNVLDEKYQDIPARVTAVERDVADLKGRLPPAAPRSRRAPRAK